MKIVIHTQYYPPEIGAPQARLSELAQLLVQRGIAVTVLTAMPNYPEGKIHEGYGGLVRVESVNGVRVVRTAIIPSQSAQLIPRLANYFSFVLSSLLLGGWYVGRADYLLTESPPLFLGIAGFVLSRWKRAKWLFNVSDLWPETAVRLGLLGDGWALKLSSRLEGFCYRHAFAVTGQSRSILASIKQRYPHTLCYHLSNGVDSRRFQEQPPEVTPGAEGRDGLVAVYAGLHGLAQGLDQILMAAGQVRDLNLRFLLVGDGPEKQALIRQAKLLSLDNVTFRDPVPRESIPELLAAADLALVPLKTNIPGAVPSKIYEAMAAGLPLILVAEGEAAEIVTAHKAGIVVQPGSTEQFVEALRCLAENSGLRAAMGRAGRAAAAEFFDRQQIARQFAAFLEQHQ